MYVFFDAKKDSSIDDPYISHEEKHANRILATTAKIIADKYGIRLGGSGLAMPGGNLKEFTLCFGTKKPLRKDELRILVLGSAQELLRHINADQEIQRAMIVYPFTEKNVDIVIYNNDENGR